MENGTVNVGFSPLAGNLVMQQDYVYVDDGFVGSFSPLAGNLVMQLRDGLRNHPGYNQGFSPLAGNLVMQHCPLVPA